MVERNVAQWTKAICGQKVYCTADIDAMWSKKILPLIGGLCHAADSDQMWSKYCPSLEDFVKQRTLTKCGPMVAPRWMTLSRSGLRPNVVHNIGDQSECSQPTIRHKQNNYPMSGSTRNSARLEGRMDHIDRSEPRKKQLTLTQSYREDAKMTRLQVQK